MKWFLSLVSKKTEYSAMQFSIRTRLLWRKRKSKHYPWDTIIKKIRMRVWNLADIWQHWDGKGGGLYIDYRRDSPHHLPPRIWLVGVRQEGGCRIRLVGPRQWRPSVCTITAAGHTGLVDTTPLGKTQTCPPDSRPSPFLSPSLHLLVFLKLLLRYI